MHALGSWCERYRSGTGARQSDRSSLWIKTRSALRLYFARSAPRSLHAPLRSHALVSTKNKECYCFIFSRLSDCSITEEGYKALASALRSNPSHLIELDLTGNDPGPSGVKQLSDLLQDGRYKLNIRWRNLNIYFFKLYLTY